MSYGYNNVYGNYDYHSNPYSNMNAYNNLNLLMNQQNQNAFPNMQQNMQPNIQNNIQQSINYVASIEEVKAHPVDWSGGINYFVDKANNCIYTKQLANDGSVLINTYRLDNQPTATAQSINKDDFVTREEFNIVKNSMDKLLEQLGGVTNEQQ